MRKRLSLRILLATLTALSLPLGVYAANADESERTEHDPPERVARLSYLKGHVLLQSEDEKDWVDGSINRPLTDGDRMRVDTGARAELQTGPLDIQLDERSDFSFLELNQDVAQARLTEGALHLTVRRMRHDEVIEVDTPHAAVAITQPGEYAIALRDGGSRTLVRTYSGEAEVTDNRQSIKIQAHEEAGFYGSENAKDVVVGPAAPRNAFDSWAHERSTRGEQSASTRYVDPDVIGYSDLDSYGDWTDEVEYGHVWYPRSVVADWSPYRYGHWTWIGPWGWTWIDDAPWGFAPFHYGRWASIHGRWGWVPGPLHVRPVYAPALVAWVGVAPPRSSVSFSFSIGSGIGWFPLAPREVYVPNYYCSRRHIYNVNYANTVVVNNVYINRAYNNRSTHFDYVNRSVHNAVTVVHADTFTHARPVRDHMVRMDQRELNTWQTRNAIPEVRPERSHMVNTGTRPEVRAPQREVVMRRQPSPMAGSNRIADRAGGGARIEPSANAGDGGFNHGGAGPGSHNWAERPQSQPSFDGGSRSSFRDRIDRTTRAASGAAADSAMNSADGSANRGGAGPGNREWTQRPESHPSFDGGSRSSFRDRIDRATRAESRAQVAAPQTSSPTPPQAPSFDRAPRDSQPQFQQHSNEGYRFRGREGGGGERPNANYRMPPSETSHRSEPRQEYSAPQPQPQTQPQESSQPQQRHERQEGHDGTRGSHERFR